MASFKFNSCVERKKGRRKKNILFLNQVRISINLNAAELNLKEALEYKDFSVLPDMNACYKICQCFPRDAGMAETAS